MATEPTKRSGVRMSADERRRAILQAAIVEFARTGFAGTSTEQIAKRAGISQPYLFRLFGTKKALFLATVGLAFDYLQEKFLKAAENLVGEEAIAAMGMAYLDYLENTDLLLLQLHAYAAAGDPDIRVEVAKRYEALADLVLERTGVSEIELGRFFSVGMLLNVSAALGLKRFQELCADLAKIS